MHVRRKYTYAAISLFLASCGGGGDSGGVTNPGPPVFSAINVLPGTVIVPIGFSQQLTVVPLDQNGGTVTGVTVSYQSNNPSNFTVSSTGLVTAVAQGTGSVTVSGTKDGVTKTANAPVVISPPPGNLAGVTAGDDLKFSPIRVDILAGGQVAFTFQATQHNVTFASTQGAPSDINATASATVNRTFPTPGTFSYTCTLHAGMNGTVVVH